MVDVYPHQNGYEFGSGAGFLHDVRPILHASIPRALTTDPYQTSLRNRVGQGVGNQTTIVVDFEKGAIQRGNAGSKVHDFTSATLRRCSPILRGMSQLFHTGRSSLNHWTSTGAVKRTSSAKYKYELTLLIRRINS
jgi:hypothetical protein